jgi:hypothetical protein
MQRYLGPTRSRPLYYRPGAGKLTSMAMQDCQVKFGPKGLGSQGGGRLARKNMK